MDLNNLALNQGPVQLPKADEYHSNNLLCGLNLFKVAEFNPPPLYYEATVPAPQPRPPK